ncbi:hypothetical protein QBC47DRAFT_382673 [Echria macrotheca]|uniref:RBR-type E3 ubiquitin transferase n=1 Tax=Echria macrotheca TaxID=438768 RepID=A0AAJ0BBP6_9PEZI|nr:hypothetical protein QBC47DRAFT_382673 [Echria macrotheca]
MCALAQPLPPVQPGEAAVCSKGLRVETPKHRVVSQQHDSAVELAVPEEEPTQLDESIDLTQYDPPAALSELSNITSETIVLVVESSLKHVIQQVQAEKQRNEELLAAERSASADSGIEVDNRSDKGKAPETAEDNDGGRISATGSSEDGGSHQGSIDDWRDKVAQRRHRLGFRRIFQHIVDKGESGSFDIGQLPAHLHGVSKPQLPKPGRAADRDATSTPSAFTKFIYKHLRQPSESTLSSSVEAIECVSCFDDIKPKQSIKTSCHHYCKGCFQQLIATALESEAQWPPKCCLNPIPFRTIAKYVGPDLLKRYWEKHEEFRVPVENRIYCSEPDCGELIRKVDKAHKTARCSKGHSMCVMCRGVPHPTSTACPQDRDRQLADQLAEEEGWRRCFKCSVLVEHKDACQHMTCRCGAQFCYVCGSIWRTCVCTNDQLTAIKQRAEIRRVERQSKESEEEAWLKNTLRLIEEYERETQRREEEERAAEAARRREERRRRAAERRRRERDRLKALDTRHAELRSILLRLNEIQRALLSSTQHRETEYGAKAAEAERENLLREQAEERQLLQTRTTAEIEELESKAAREFGLRAAWEQRLEDEYATALRNFWAKKEGGESQVERELLAFMVQNDQRWDAWKEERDDVLEKKRYAVQDELAVREELMLTMRRRLETTSARLAAEQKTKHQAERLWFDLVITERARLLAEMYSVERENGGENNGPSGSDSDSDSDDDEADV